MRQRPGLSDWARSIRYPRAVRTGRGLRARRTRDLRPYTRNPRLAFRLLRAASRLGVPGAIPAPPQLLPMGARVLAQGYLNRFAMPLLNGWLLPPWMREQSDPQSPMFTPRSVFNLMVNQTARNWTALGLPGANHPVESTVDRWGLLIPIPGGPSLDWWVEVEGGNLGLMAASRMADVKQRLQDDLPVIVTAYEADGLRVSSEAWMLALEDGDWAAMQVVLFNIADIPLRGTFMFALRPYNCEGISPVYNLTYEGGTLRTRTSHAGPLTWPKAESFALSDLRSGDLFQIQTPKSKTQNPKCHDPHGFAHGILSYSFNIEPWEEAEFIALMPVHARATWKVGHDFGFQVSGLSDSKLKPDPQFYSRAKAETTLKWRALFESGMKIDVPDRHLQASWEANRAHLLALHDGASITPGPDLYHSFWFRDAAYMVYALSLMGFREAAEQLLQGFVSRQRRDGVFISHHGESDSTGQALWAMSRHLRLYPNAALQREWKPAMERGARWIARALLRSEDLLMPPGISSEHLGPPDRYYWDNLWSLAGLEGVQAEETAKSATTLRRTLTTAWEADKANLQRQALPAAPGRKIDLGMVGTLAAWFPLELLSTEMPELEDTLAALEENTFYDGALFVGTGHSGWGTYLNMRIAGCRLLQNSDKGWEMMKWLLRHASPTYNWPEAIHPRSLGGSAGDGHHGWASAEWLMLVRTLLLREEGGSLIVTPSLPKEWLSTEGEIKVENAPTTFGPISFNMAWGAGGQAPHLDIEARWHTPPGRIEWNFPGRENSVLPPDARSAQS